MILRLPSSLPQKQICNGLLCNSATSLSTAEFCKIGLNNMRCTIILFSIASCFVQRRDRKFFAGPAQRSSFSFPGYWNAAEAPQILLFAEIAEVLLPMVGSPTPGLWLLRIRLPAQCK